VLVVGEHDEPQASARADVPAEPAAAAKALGVGEERQERPVRSASDRVVGAGPGAAGGGGRGDARRDAADLVQLARAARGRRRAASAPGSKGPRTALGMDGAAAPLPGLEHDASAGGTRVRLRRVDGGAPGAARGDVGRHARVGHDAARAVAPPRVRVEASSLRAPT
jgi:hypothetical protein